VTFMRASPVSMRNDLDGEARGIGVPECAIEGARRAYEWGARGDEGRCNGSGEEEPESEDIGVSWRVS
jgi:hypothetical protein